MADINVKVAMQSREYYGFSGWSGEDYNSIASSFEANIGPEPEFVYAVYSTPAYEGCADVVFKRDGEWWHASGGHCSCYGLEGQWGAEKFNPQDHLSAVADGRQLLLIADTEGDYPQATQEHFNEWLRWAAQR